MRIELNCTGVYPLLMLYAPVELISNSVPMKVFTTSSVVFTRMPPGSRMRRSSTKGADEGAVVTIGGSVVASDLLTSKYTVSPAGTV